MTAPLPPLHHETHDRELLNMTAPLPPLPIPAIHERSPGGRNLFAYSEGQLHEFAKLAVREALEQAASKIQADLTEAEQTWQPHRTIADQAFIDAKSQCVQDIRAMLKEYSDD
jgi:hypothetical protein